MFRAKKHYTKGTVHFPWYQLTQLFLCHTAQGDAAQKPTMELIALLHAIAYFGKE